MTKRTQEEKKELESILVYRDKYASTATNTFGSTRLLYLKYIQPLNLCIFNTHLNYPMMDAVTQH